MSPSPRWLTVDQVLAIREARAAGATARGLADEYGLHFTAVYDIVTGTTYRGIGGPTCARKPPTRLTPTTVVALREAHARGVSRDRLIAQYGIHPATAYNALTGVSWANVGGPLMPRPPLGPARRVDPGRAHRRQRGSRR